MAREVWTGLTQPVKELPSKYFYDERGSSLFDQITQLSEYYLTRTESALLHEVAPPLIATHGTGTLVELGAGSGEKTRTLLAEMVRLEPPRMYVPVDISKTYLETIARTFSEEYPQLQVRPAFSDIARGLRLPNGLRTPTLFAFLGSTIGNFEHDDAIALLSRVARLIGERDRFLIGFDLKKDPAILHAAYNDAQGVTAAFNRNLLVVLNRDLGCDFDVEAFEHRAFYDENIGRIEMHLIAREPQVVRIADCGTVRFEAGESVRTEISCKYDRAQVEGMLAAAGLALRDWDQDANAFFALVTAERV